MSAGTRTGVLVVVNARGAVPHVAHQLDPPASRATAI